MKFVLELWPEDEDWPAVDLLADAVRTIREVDGLVWDILDDDNNVLHENVSLRPNVVESHNDL